MIDILEYWKDKGLRATIENVIENGEIWSDGAYQIQIFNQADFDVEIKINGADAITLGKNKEMVPLPLTLGGEPYIKRYDNLVFDFLGELGKVSVIRTYVVPITEGAQKTVYEVGQG